MRILYIEDNPANISLLQRIARMGGHDVLYYNDGEVALANFTRDNPDLILVDLQLAGVLGGLDVVRKLRSDGVKLPIVAVTAYAMVGDKERCLEAGCDGYLAKPLPVAELVEIVQKYQLASKGSDATPASAAPAAPAAETQKPRQEDATVPDRAQVLGETAPLPDPARNAAGAPKPEEAKAPPAASKPDESAAPGAPKPGESPAPKPEPPAAPKADTGTVSGVTAPKADTAPAPKIGTAPLGSVPAAPTAKPETPAEKPPTPATDSAAQTPKPADSAASTAKPADNAAPTAKPADGASQESAAPSNGSDTIKFAVAPQKAENGKKE